MPLDLTKPMRFKANHRKVVLVHKLEKSSSPWPYLVVSANKFGEEGGGRYSSLDFLENIPQSRWLNVYVGTESSVSPRWFDNKGDAEVSRRTARDMQCVAVIEDKQDGSDWIVHKL